MLDKLLLTYGIFLALICKLFAFISNLFANMSTYLDDAIGELDADREKIMRGRSHE